MTWLVGSTSGANWEVGTSTDPGPTFAILGAGDYQHGQSCVLQVVGADGTYSVKWSPANDPDDADAVTLTLVTDDLDVNGDGTITVTAARGVVRYGDTGYLWLIQGVDESGFPKSLIAETGKQYVELTSPLADTGDRITAIPDLAAGDQLIWWNAQPSGDVEVAADASFVADVSVDTFEVEPHVAGDGYGTSAVQNVSLDIDDTEPSGILADSETGSPTLGQEHALTVSGIVAVPDVRTTFLGGPVTLPEIEPDVEARFAGAANRTAIRQSAVRSATFVYIDIPGDPVRVNTSALNVTTGGYTWTGTGTLAGVESVTEDTSVIGAPVRLSLSGITSDMLTDIQTADYRNRDVEIYLGFFDQDWRLIADLEPLWSGVADYAHMTVGDGDAVVILTCENELSALIGRPIPIRYTDQEQRRRFTGDRFFKLLPAQFDLQIEWGGGRVSGGYGGGGTGIRDEANDPNKSDHRLH